MKHKQQNRQQGIIRPVPLTSARHIMPMLKDTGGTGCLMGQTHITPYILNRNGRALPQIRRNGRVTPLDIGPILIVTDRYVMVNVRETYPEVASSLATNMSPVVPVLSLAKGPGVSHKRKEAYTQ